MELLFEESQLLSGSTGGSYVVLARKWRPQQFEDLVGQNSVVRTLMNAIRASRIHQAYLFTGSRGIGKTTIARIFAKALRCPNAVWTDSGQLRACDQCASCLEVISGNGVDVMEIDGASNNGVDAIRELRENAKYLPSIGSKKIFIIDEVHMLTTAAFNALLKTLEEPPAHVIFIFATTEPHKIPATILSRVQRFDFRRATPAQIRTLLERVALAEGLDAEPAALALLSRAAEGSMRDSLSLLDQVIAYSGKEITVQSARESIGLIESTLLFDILKAVFSRCSQDALQALEQAHQQGHDLRLLTKGLIETLHAVILAKVGFQQPSSIELSEEEWAEVSALAALRDLEELELIFQALNAGVEWIARSPHPKLVLDVLLIKCSASEALATLDEHSVRTQNSTPLPQQRLQRASEVATKIMPGILKTLSTGELPQQPIAKVVVSVESSGLASWGKPLSSNSPVATPSVMISQEATKPKGPVHAISELNWELFTKFVKKERPLLSSVLEHGTCKTLNSTVTLFYRAEDAYFREQLQARAYHEQFLTLFKDFFGPDARVVIELNSDSSNDIQESPATRREREEREHDENARNTVQNHPIIREAQALFGGNLGPIELFNAEPIGELSNKESGHA